MQQDLSIIISSTNHVLHADAYFTVVVETAVKSNNVRGVTVVQYLEFADNLVSYRRFYFKMYQLNEK